MCGKWNWLWVLLPIGVIVFCGWFFWYVFNRTMVQCNKEPSVVQFSVANDCLTNAVFYEISKSRVEEITSDVLTNRAEIAEKEHDRFRAELATWLSVFGLLTLLVSLITPVCSLVFQQKEFERLQKLIDSQSKSIEDIKGKYEDISQKAAQVEKDKTQVENDKNSIGADLVERHAQDFAESHAQHGDQDDLRSALNIFKGLWGEDRLEEKLSAGIKLFSDCNTVITDAIASEDYDRLKNCLNVMNNANAYLGMRNLEKFRGNFSFQMRQVCPLKHSNEEVVRALESGGINGPIKGFYKSALNLQGGMPG